MSKWKLSSPRRLITGRTASPRIDLVIFVQRDIWGRKVIGLRVNQSDLRDMIGSLKRGNKLTIRTQLIEAEDDRP